MSTPMSEEGVLEGPKVGSVPDCSLAEYLLDKMNTLPSDRVIQVDGDTGEVQTVGDLLEKSVRLCEGLKKLGLRAGDIIAMMRKNSFEADEIVLASWLGQATIAPLDGTMKVGEMKHFLDLIRPQFIFCEEEAVANLSKALDFSPTSPVVIFISKAKSPTDGHLVFEDVFANVDASEYKAKSVNSPATQLAGILPSSGSSGLPKGVGITQRNLIYQDVVMNQLNIFNHNMDCLQISQFVWVSEILTFLLSLTSGMKRILVRDPTPINILKAIHKYKTEWTIMAPLLALSVVNDSRFEDYDVSSMKLILVGGSPFTPSIGEKVTEKWRGAKFVQCYGTSESTGVVSVVEDGGDPYSIGKVVPGMQVKVVDTSTGECLQSNSLGELWMKSEGLMKGYFGNEKATEEVIDGNGWLHSGDLVYYDDSYQLFYVERIKEMIKVMNKQISPVEIENAMLAIDGVLEAGVTGVSKDGTDFELVGLVVKEKNSRVTADEIQSHIAKTLSDYKRLTGGVYFVKSFPKTSSGKLRRRELDKMAQMLT